MVSPGLAVIWIYLGFTYGLPWIYNTLFNLQDFSGYRIYPLHGWAIVFVLVFALSLLLFDKTKSAPQRTMENSELFLSKRRKWRLPVAMLCFSIAMAGYFLGMNGFRYAEDSGFAGAGWLIFPYATLPTLLRFDFFYQLFLRRRGTHQEEWDPLAIRLLIAGTFVLTINGTWGSAFALVYCFFAVSPRTFKQFFTKSDLSYRKKVRLILIPLGLVSLVGVAWIYGETVKRHVSFEAVISQITDPNYTQVAVLSWMERFSSSYYSLLMGLNNHLLQFDLQPFENLVLPFRAFVYRLDVLAGQPFSVLRPELSNLCRLNYELISLLPRAREGTSPGLITSFLLCFPFPLNLIVLMFYSVGLMKVINLLVRNMVRVPNIFGLCLIMWFCLTLFASPIDFLLVVDDGAVEFGLFLWLYLRLRSLGKRGKSLKQANWRLARSC